MARPGPGADSRGMRPLSPAATELRWVAAWLAVGAAVPPVATGQGLDPRATVAGLAAAVAALAALGGARAVRRAIRLALPVGARWSREAPARTAVRALTTQALPMAGAGHLAGALAADDVPAAPSAAAGAIAGVGACALMAAARIGRAERTLGRRLLRRPRWGRLLDRRSLYLEPDPRPARAAAAPSPWPAHRPPARVPGAAIEIEPANVPARHPVGVRGRPPGRQPPPGPPS